MVCSKCGNEIAEGKKFCAKCGSPAVPITMVCPKCSSFIKEGKKFCTKCGFALGARPSQPIRSIPTQHPKESVASTPFEKSKDSSPHLKSKALFPVCCALVLVLGIATFWFLGDRDNKNEIADAMQPVESSAPENSVQASFEASIPASPVTSDTGISSEHDETDASSESISSDDETKKVALYRVRKSVDDAASQIGAFAELSNAKEAANERKADGYKVFDMSGNLLYDPSDTTNP